MRKSNKLPAYKTTWKYDRDGNVVVIYQETTIVQEFPGAIVLNNGGFDTTSTRRRMNQASAQFGLGYEVTKNGAETIVKWKGKIVPFQEKSLFLFDDGETKQPKPRRRRIRR